MAYTDWIARQGVTLPEPGGVLSANAGPRLEGLRARLAAARVVFLGETNHFVREKTDFRLFWLEQLLRHGAVGNRPVIVGEELGWADGRWVAAYLETGDESLLARAATFGGTGHLRQDRDDSPTGVFAPSFRSYPHALMHAEHVRLYRGLRELRPAGYFGFDMDAPGAGYEYLGRLGESGEAADLPVEFWSALALVSGESLTDEAARLEAVLERFASVPGFARVAADVRAMAGSLRYTALLNPATDYEATRPAMAWREELMKRRVDDVLAGAPEDALLVLMGHAFHLAKDDAGLAGPGVGPGGGRVSSLGHHLCRERGLASAGIWMLYGSGEDSQPLADLPRVADYPADTLNRTLLEEGTAMLLPLTEDAPFQGAVRIGHLYNLVAEVDIRAQADALHFFPRVTPLGDPGGDR